MYSPTDRYIEICWRAAYGSRDSIYISEIHSFLRELQDFVGASSLFTKNEVGLLRNMAEKRPLLQMRKSEAEAFLLKLANFSSMEELLRVRSRTNSSLLRRLVDNYPNQPRPEPRTSVEAETARDDTSWFGSWWKYGKREPERLVERKTENVPSERPERTSLFRNPLGARDAYLRTPDVFSSRNMKIEPEPYRPKDLFSKIKIEPEPYRSDIFRRQRTENSFVPRDLFNNSSMPGAYDDSARQEERILELERLCLKYRQELEDMKANSGYEQLRTVRQLRDTLAEQERHIRDLRMQLQLGDRPSLVWKIPFVQQYLRYQNGQSRTWASAIVECVTLVLTFVLLINLLKLVYYTALTVAGLKMIEPLEIFEDDAEIAFSWLQQIPWLEYKVYQVEQWIYG